MWLHHLACVMCDVHASVVDVCAGMAAQVMEKYWGHVKDIPANTRIVEINVGFQGTLHKLMCVMTSTDGHVSSHHCACTRDWMGTQAWCCVWTLLSVCM